MPAIKLVIGLSDGRCVQKEIAEEQSRILWGKKIGEAIEGDTIGLAGYSFLITGGSDYCGFPMRKDVQGPSRRRILAVKGVGLKQKAKGVRVRKTVCGNTIHGNIVQINVKVTKAGAEPLAPPKAEQPAENKPLQ